jgi:putative hydrolase of the HAD superfamily
MLAELRKAGLTLGVVSNTFVPARVLDRHLEEEGMLEQLPVRVYSCDVGYRKPRRTIFREALRRAGLNAAETLFVGDSPRADVAGANRMGMITVLKDPTGRYANGRGLADHRVRSILQLREIVEEHNGGGADREAAPAAS